MVGDPSSAYEGLCLLGERLLEYCGEGLKPFIVTQSPSLLKVRDSLLSQGCNFHGQCLDGVNAIVDFQVGLWTRNRQDRCKATPAVTSYHVKSG
jgi:hypothetical protein